MGLDHQTIDSILDNMNLFRTLAAKMHELENYTQHETGVIRLNGGFAIATMIGYYPEDDDSPYIEVCLKWGQQDDTTNSVHTEIHLFDIPTLEWR